MECELREDGTQMQRLSWLQASEGSSKLHQPKGLRYTVTPRCWNLLLVRQLLVDQPGGLAIPGLVCHVLHKLQGDGICKVRDGAQVKRTSRPTSKFVDGSPHLAARVYQTLSESVFTKARVKER